MLKIKRILSKKSIIELFRENYMLKTKTILLCSSAILASVSIFNTSHSSDPSIDGEYEAAPQQVSQGYGWGMLWPGNWFGGSEEIDEDTTSPEKKQIATITENIEEITPPKDTQNAEINQSNEEEKQ